MNMLKPPENFCYYMDTNFIMVRILIMQKGKDERYS
jgi:hypothetical protein